MNDAGNDTALKGGTALRFELGLPRPSTDLDFEGNDAIKVRKTVNGQERGKPDNRREEREDGRCGGRAIRFTGSDHRGLTDTLPTTCFGPRPAAAGFVRRDLADDEPVAEHAARGEVLLDGRDRSRVGPDVGGHVERRHIAERKPARLAPGQKLPHRPPVRFPDLLRSAAGGHVRGANFDGVAPSAPQLSAGPAVPAAAPLPTRAR